MTGHLVLRVGGHDNTIVRRVLGDEPSHAHVDEGGDPWWAVTRSAADARVIVEAVNGFAVEVAAEVETVRRQCEQRIADLQAEFARTDKVRNRQLEQLQALQRRALAVSSGLPPCHGRDMAHYILTGKGSA